MSHISKPFIISCSILILVTFTAGNAFSDTTYVVKSGDNISKIAKKFRVSQDELKEANNLESNKLSKGQRLTVPTGDSESAVKKSETVKKSAVNTEKTEPLKNEENSAVVKVEKPRKLKPAEGDEFEIDYEYHKVQPGETLQSIAKRYRISEKDLRAINDLKRKKIRPGQNLIVGNLSAADEYENAKKRKIRRVDISDKIEEVRALSESEELAKLPAKERLLLFAKKLMNLPYKFGANGVFGLDCSSYVQKVYSFVDMQLPRSAREQFKVGEKIAKDELKSGDLIFFRTYARFPSHVGIYLGDNLFIHASSLSKKVRIDSLDRPFYTKRYIGAKRILEENEDPKTSKESDAVITPAFMNIKE